MARRRKLDFQRKEIPSNYTFDHNGKVIYMKKPEESSLPSIIEPKPRLSKKFKMARLPDRPEDKQKDEKLISRTKQILENAISVHQPLMQRLKSARGTVDIKNEQEVQSQDPSASINLKPGVALNQNGITKKGPKFTINAKMTLQEYLTKAKSKRINTRFGIIKHESAKIHQSIESIHKEDM
jgi:hypothetical protein